MQLRPDQLTAHLQKNLLPMYLVSGDETLLVQESCEAIRTQAVQRGFSERQVFHCETGFSWPNFFNNTNTRSLFSDKQLLELRVVNQLGDAGSKALQAYAAKPPPDKILIIITGKLEAATQRSAWFTAIAKVGVTLQVWPLDNNQFTQWLQQRLHKAELKVPSAGIQLLLDSTEGNLLAAAQEIEKLRLLYGQGTLTTEQIATALSNHTHFDIFALGDACLQGNGKRILRILANLKGEGIEPTLILWALTRELRSLSTLATATAQGMPVERALQQQYIWEKRKPFFRHALQKHSTSTLHKLLQQAGIVDRTIKGVELGNVWDQLSRLALGTAGIAGIP